MRFHFTADDGPTTRRARDIRAALVHAGHVVTHDATTGAPPAGTDAWFHGLGANGRIPCDPELVERLIASPLDVVLYQLSDSDTMSFHKIVPELEQKSRLFLRNHWPTDKATIPEPYRARLGYLPPMIRPIAPVRGAPLHQRSRGAMFYGTPTGTRHFPEGRERLLERLHASGLPFEGGLSPDPGCPREPPPELTVPRMPAREHARRLADAKICLAPWGNHKLTYRLFEGLAARCLVVSQPFDDVDFLHGGLEPGVHYVATAPDHADVVEVVRYYLERPDAAQRIADAGHEHYRRYLAPRGKLVARYVFDASVASWGPLYRPAASRARPGSALRAAAARVFPGWF